MVETMAPMKVPYIWAASILRGAIYEGGGECIE